MKEETVKKLIPYDMKRVLTRCAKEFGKISHGTEDQYNPQLHYIEQGIYQIYQEIKISDYDLQEAISVILYDLKSHIDLKVYDYEDLVDEKTISFAKELEMLFNPFLNKEIQLKEEAKRDLKKTFTLPIICLMRIHESIDFWRNRYGKDGYFKMLEEYVAPIIHIGKYPYALEEQDLV